MMNEHALREKITEASKTIFSFCMAKTANREEAEDLSQDILYALMNSIGNIRDDNAFYGFMWSVAENVCKQWYRKKRMHITCELTEDIPDTEDYFRNVEEESSDIYLLRRELTLLSEKYRKATILYYIKGKSCTEISSILAISDGMVKYLLFKSRKILKEGMQMERTLGERSYNPKTLIPLYSGEGPNRFYDLMQSKIRQNIVSACYNDALTVQQISLEIGIPLPYLDDEIKALESKNIIVRDGTHYQSNVVIVTADCSEEIARAVTKYHTLIADRMESFLCDTMKAYKKLGFVGNQFSEKTLRWQLAAVLFLHMMFGIDYDDQEVPRTGWGERAYLWCAETVNEKQLFSYSNVDSKCGDRLYFFDYQNNGKGKGDHHDFYGNSRYINIFCGICRGEHAAYSEYDMEAIAEMIRKGYIVKDGDALRAAVPIYTAAQYQTLVELADAYIDDNLKAILKEMDETSARILGAHTPKHLQNQVRGIAGMDKFVNGICIPASILIERQVLDTAWHPLEMPTTYVVLHD